MTSLEMAQQTFTNVLPELERMARPRFKHLPIDRRDDAVAETIALTWKGYYALIEQGQGDDPGVIRSVLWFSIKQVRCGRTVWRASNERAKDTIDAIRWGRLRVRHLDLDDITRDIGTVPEQVQVRVDLPAYLDTLTPRRRRMAESLMLGMTTTEVAHSEGVSMALVSQFRGEFRDGYEAFCGG